MGGRTTPAIESDEAGKPGEGVASPAEQTAGHATGIAAAGARQPMDRLPRLLGTDAEPTVTADLCECAAGLLPKARRCPSRGGVLRVCWRQGEGFDPLSP